MEAKVYNQKGEEKGKIKLPKEIFEVSLNSDLLHQVVVFQKGNRRQKSAEAKGRAEVRGGGRKPWRQKGTGRARHGSIRSPLWKGGGVTFGPTEEKKIKKRIPKKMRRKALLMALSSKARDKEIIILDKLEVEKGKTKEFMDILNNLKIGDGNLLVVVPEKEDKIVKASRNIPGKKTVRAEDLNALDILNFKNMMMPKQSLKVIKENFIK